MYSRERYHLSSECSEEGVSARLSEEKSACISVVLKRRLVARVSEDWDRVIIAGDASADVRLGRPSHSMKRRGRRFCTELVPRAGPAAAGLSFGEAGTGSTSDISLAADPRGLGDGHRQFLFALAIGDLGLLLLTGTFEATRRERPCRARFSARYSSCVRACLDAACSCRLATTWA